MDMPSTADAPDVERSSFSGVLVGIDHSSMNNTIADRSRHRPAPAVSGAQGCALLSDADPAGTGQHRQC
jgi:hypothetical protein